MEDSIAERTFNFLINSEICYQDEAGRLILRADDRFKLDFEVNISLKCQN
jgi:hypothetical protein